VKEPVGAEALAHRIGEAAKLDAVVRHDAHAPKLQAFSEVENSAALEQCREGLIGRERGRADGERRQPRPSGIPILSMLVPRASIRKAVWKQAKVGTPRP
jgi:hypothetical protein